MTPHSGAASDKHKQQINSLHNNASCVRHLHLRYYKEKQYPNCRRFHRGKLPTRPTIASHRIGCLVDQLGIESVGRASFPRPACCENEPAAATDEGIGGEEERLEKGRGRSKGEKARRMSMSASIVFFFFTSFIPAHALTLVVPAASLFVFLSFIHS